MGGDYPVILRLGGNDLIPESLGNEEIAEFAHCACQSGIDMINVTGGWHESRVPQITGDLPAGGFSYLAEGIKKAVTVPVSMANRMNSPLVAEENIAMERCDLVTMGRPLLADPRLPQKAMEGREWDIRPCMGCNQGCLANTFFDRPIECLVNARCGRELDLSVEKTKAPRNILVIGAGPSGLEASTRAAQKGHGVTLWEKSGRIGGLLHQTSKTPAHEDFAKLIDYYGRALNKYGVKIVLNREYSEDLALTDENGKPFDDVIVCIGGEGGEFSIPHDDSFQLMDIDSLLFKEEIPGKDVVFIGSAFTICQSALFLARESALSKEQLYHLSVFGAENGKKIASLLNNPSRNISIVDRGKKIGVGFESGVGWPCMSELSRLGVKKYPLTEVLEIKNGTLVGASSTKDEGTKEIRLHVDTLIYAKGAKPRKGMEEKMTGQYPGVGIHFAGNASKMGRVIDAIRAGCEAACSID